MPPDQRNPASQHLLELMTHHKPADHNVTNLKGNPISVDTNTAITTTEHPTAAAAAKCQAKHCHYQDGDLLQRELQQMDITLNPWCNVVQERIPVKGKHPTLGLVLRTHPAMLRTVQVTSCQPGSSAAKHIHRFRRRLWNVTISTINGNYVHTLDDVQRAIDRTRTQHQAHIEITFRSPLRQSMTGEGLPTLHFDQLNVLAQHLQAVRTGEPTTWHSPQRTREWPYVNPEDLQFAISKGLTLPKLTRKRLIPTPHWPHFLTSEWTQLNKYKNQDIFGEPCPPSEVGASAVLPWVCTYLFKIDLNTLAGTLKSRGTCNGGKRYGKVITLAETYAACVEQPAHRLMWALTAALNFVALSCYVVNAFAEAPPPDKPFYMLVDEPFQQWQTECLGKDPIPAGWVIPINKNLQGHPEAQRLWHKHIHEILLNDLGFQSTTHETCLYYKQMTTSFSFFAKLMISLLHPKTWKHVNRFASRYSHTWQTIFTILVSSYVKIHCKTYIEKVLEHHDRRPTCRKSPSPYAYG